MSPEIVKYEHHGVEVSVRADLKGTHREHCLCFGCDKFKINEEGNCEAAKDLYAFCIRHNMTTPVFECPDFVQITPWYAEYADSVGVMLNANPEVVRLTLEGLELNEELHGERYCPCQIERSPDVICPCKNMRENQHCCCGLFKKKEAQ